MQPLALGEPSRRPPRPGAGLRVQGLERRRRRRLGGAAVRRRLARRHALRDDRPRGVLRLPGDPPAGPLHRRPHARDQLAGGRDLRGARAARAARPRPPRRARAVDALAHVLRADHRPRRGARHADGRVARRAARRRPAHAPGRRSPASRPTRRSSTASTFEPRPTRARPASSASCTTPAQQAGHAVARACGRASRTTSPRRRTRRPRSRSCASSRGSSASRSTPASSRAAAADYERQVSLAVQSDPDVQAFVERLEQAAEEEEAEEGDPPDLPSGDVIAREFQRFLRQRGSRAAEAVRLSSASTMTARDGGPRAAQIVREEQSRRSACARAPGTRRTSSSSSPMRARRAPSSPRGAATRPVQRGGDVRTMAARVASRAPAARTAASPPRSSARRGERRDRSPACAARSAAAWSTAATAPTRSGADVREPEPRATLPPPTSRRPPRPP